MIPRAPAIALAALALLTARASEPIVLSRSAYLMGTRVSLAALAGDREAASRSLEALLQSLEASEARLSTWRSDTALGRLNAAPPERPAALDPALCGLFRRLASWREQTGGRFDPAIGPLVDAWGIERAPRVPDGEEIARLLPRSRLPAWRVDPAACTVTRPDGGRLDSGGFGKGAAIDAAATVRVEALGWLIDLGGQIGVAGGAPEEGWRVGVAHPARREAEWLSLRMRRGSLATSGGSERDRQAGGHRIGHILDPRTGRPATFAGSVVVWHADGLAADVLSTALYVMGPDDGLPWAEARGVAACYLVPRGGDVVQRATSAWQRRPWR